MNVCDEDLIDSIDRITSGINKYGTLSILLLGTIGNLLNLFVFFDRHFRENPCATYLWWSSISSIVFIWSGLFTRVLKGYVFILSNTQIN